MGMSGKRVLCSAVAVVVCMGGLATPVLARGRHHYRRKAEASTSMQEGGAAGTGTNGSRGSNGTPGRPWVEIVPGQSPALWLPGSDEMTSLVKNLLGPNRACLDSCTGVDGKAGGDGTAGALATGADGADSSGPASGSNGADAVGGNGTAGANGS